MTGTCACMLFINNSASIYLNNELEYNFEINRQFGLSNAWFSESLTHFNPWYFNRLTHNP
jgi:hypothetical protein